jgi:hypothetical protein
VEEARAWAADERGALAAKLLAATGERDAALRRVRELTAALGVSAAEGARARCAARARRRTRPLCPALCRSQLTPDAPVPESKGAV